MTSRREWCICCGQETDWGHVARLPGFLFGCDARISKCQTCGLGKTSPAPLADSKYYMENDRYEDLFVKKADIYKKFAYDLLGCLVEAPYLGGERLLDIGCGGGFLVEAANNLGFAAEGIDANSAVVAWARARGLNIHEGDIAGLSSSSKFDVVVLSAVLEHVPYPEELLGRVKSLLRPHGRILISQASYDGLLPRLFPWGWYGWQPAEHYWHFTPHAMEQLVLRAGMSVKHWNRNSLYHPWFLKGSLKELVGRNVAAMLSRTGNRLSMGDSFCMVVSHAQ